MVTNQPDLARGALTRPSSRRCTRGSARQLPLDDIVVCPHDDDDGCWCRKPRPGMILDAARRLGLDLDRSVGVGDRWRDVDAAHRAGVAPSTIDWGLGEPLRDSPDARFGSLPRHGIMSCRCAAPTDGRVSRTGRDRLGDRT